MKKWCPVVIVGVVVGVLVGCASSGVDEPSSDPGMVKPVSEEAPEISAEEPPVNTLKWTTASEVDNFGFDIYRGLSKEGPFDRITAEPLPGAGTTDEPQSYVYLDEDIDGSRDYYYYIESISLGGIRETFSPIIKAPAKRP